MLNEKNLKMAVLIKIPLDTIFHVTCGDVDLGYICSEALPDETGEFNGGNFLFTSFNSSGLIASKDCLKQALYSLMERYEADHISLSSRQSKPRRNIAIHIIAIG